MKLNWHPFVLPDGYWMVIGLDDSIETFEVIEHDYSGFDSDSPFGAAVDWARDEGMSFRASLLRVRGIGEWCRFHETNERAAIRFENETDMALFGLAFR